MNFAQRYLEVIWDANHQMKEGTYEFHTVEHAKRFKDRLQDNKHIALITQSGTKVTIIYDN